MKKRITLLTLFLLAVMTMSAIPARPNLWRMITLADGSQVKARLVATSTATGIVAPTEIAMYQ